MVTALWRWRKYKRWARKQIVYRHRSGGYLYFVRGRRENPLYIKIGRTNRILRRSKEAKTYISPHGVYILGVCRVRSDVYAERWVFERFSKERLDTSNEWFYTSIRLIIFMYAVRDMKLTKETRKNVHP